MRPCNRKYNELRNIEIIPDYNMFAEGSCLIKCGNTHVICTATVDDKIPQWLKNEEKGWITAEYSLLPRSTKTRVSRETKGVGGRTHEIQRLIGRSLRAITDLKILNGYSILIDCDVIQADGGTRTASITGSYVALYIALEKMVKNKQITHNPIKEAVGAISVGICDNKPLLDLEYEEDSNAQVDSNVILTKSGKIVDFQTTSEGEPYEYEKMLELFAVAKSGIDKIIGLY